MAAGDSFPEAKKKAVSKNAIKTQARAAAERWWPLGRR